MKLIKYNYNFLQKANTLDLYIYDDVKEGYWSWWDGYIESETSADFIRQKLEENPNIEQINLYINSFGGDVAQGYGIYSQLKRHKANVTVYIDGFCASIASVIAMAGDNIIMGTTATMMIHNMFVTCMGNANQLRKAADDLDVLMVSNRQAYLEKSNGKISEEKLIEFLNAETYLTPEQCLEYGFADEISLAKDNQKIANQFEEHKKTILQHFIKVEQPKFLQQFMKRGE